MSKSKKDSYIIIFSDGYDHPSITAIAQMFEECCERKKCPNFAISGLTDFRISMHEVENRPLERGRSARDCDAKKLQIANADGKRVEIVSVMTKYLVNHGFQHNCWPERHTIVGSKRVVKKLGYHYENLLDQLFQYVHMKLAGFCSRKTKFDEPKMNRLDNLIERVDMLQNTLADTKADNATVLGNCARIEAIEEKVERLLEAAQSDDDSDADSSLGKRQRLID